jgi:hypothetical protein
MPTQATIAITPGAGQLLDAVSLVIGANTVVRETMVIADPTNPTSLAGVTVGGALRVDASATTQPVSGTIAISNFPATQPVSIAGSVAVTGTITANQGTSPWVVSLTSTTITGSVAVTGTFFQATQPVSIAGSVVVSNAGTFAVQATLSAETTKIIGTVNQGTSPWVISGAVTTSGTATVVGTKTNNNAAPDGNNVGVLPAIANAASPAYTEGDQVLLSTDLTGALRVNGTFTGTVSQNITQWNSVALGSPSAYGTSPGAVNVIGVNAFVTNTVSVTGTITAVTAITNALPAGTNLLGSVKISDGTNVATVKAASTAALSSDTAIVVTTNGSTTAGAPANTAVTSTSSAVLAANVARREALITNTDTVVVYVGLGQVPTATAYHVALRPCTVAHDGTGGSFVTDIWKGAINAIVASTTGHIAIAELT